MPRKPAGNAACADNLLLKRVPHTEKPSVRGTQTPSFSRASTALGIKASPRPYRLAALRRLQRSRETPDTAAIAAANPAGPPPITKTSVEVENSLDITIQVKQAQNRIRAPSPQANQASRAPGGDASLRPRAPPILKPMKISDFAQTIPRSVQLAVVQAQCVGRSLQHFWTSGMQNETLEVAFLKAVICEKGINVATEILPNEIRDLGR